MLFEGDEDNFICDDCLEEFPDDYCSWSEDEQICYGCMQERYLKWKEEPCVLCGKPMKIEEKGCFHNPDSDYAHKSCVDKLTEKQLMEQEWSDEYY